MMKVANRKLPPHQNQRNPVFIRRERELCWVKNFGNAIVDDSVFHYSREVDWNHATQMENRFGGGGTADFRTPRG